jgi:hypothetical protein
MASKIRSFIAAGEGERAKKLALAICEDPRFMPLDVNAEIPVDCQFLIESACVEPSCLESSSPCPACGGRGMVRRRFLAELKECKDYVISALGRDGHLYLQHLAMSEAGHRSIIVVLGGDNQVADAIFQILKTQYHGDELKYEMESYKKRLFDFEAKCFASGIPVMRWQLDPFRRLLSHAHKVLTDASLMDYRPRPAEGERELCAASCLHRGIGPELMKVLLDEYQLAFVPRGDYAVHVEELPGWGKKRCAQVNPMIRMIYRRHV